MARAKQDFDINKRFLIYLAHKLLDKELFECTDWYTDLLAHYWIRNSLNAQTGILTYYVEYCCRCQNMSTILTLCMCVLDGSEETICHSIHSTGILFILQSSLDVILNKLFILDKSLTDLQEK